MKITSKKQGVQSLKILNIVIYYNNEDEVIRYATELSKLNNIEEVVLVIVINGASSKNFSSLVCEMEKLSIDFEIFNPNCNLGYLNGAIFGYKSYIEKYYEKPDWILISNTDISFNELDIFRRFSTSRYDDDIWVVGPSVYSSASKSYSYPQYIARYSRKFINRNIFIFTYPILAYFFMKASRIKAYLKTKKKKPYSSYSFSVHGCFFFIRSVLADYLVNNPHKSLMYSEEGYIANIVLRMGKKSLYDSNIEVTHFENTVTKLIGIKKKSKYIAESLKHIRDEFYSDEIRG